MKKIKKDALESKQMIEFTRSEMAVLQKVEHINLMGVVEIMEDNKYFYMVCELVSGGDLQDRLNDISYFKEKDVAIIVK